MSPDDKKFQIEDALELIKEDLAKYIDLVVEALEKGRRLEIRLEDLQRQIRGREKNAG